MSDFVLFLNAGDTFHDTNSCILLGDLVTDKNKVYFGRTEVMAGQKTVKWLPSINEVNVNAWTNRNLSATSIRFFSKCFYSKNKYDLYLAVASDNDYKIRAIKQCGIEFIDVNVSKFYLGGSRQASISITCEQEARSVLF